MFTGLIDHTGTITAIENTSGGKRFFVTSRFADLAHGESIAVDGVCLTITQTLRESFVVEASPETLEKSICDGYVANTPVNLERALRLSDRLGGHIVTGHVDEKGVVLEKSRIGDFVRIEIGVLANTSRRYGIPKGSVSVNGVSLTINDHTAGGLELMLIPKTLELTNLNALEKGMPVNIEWDFMVKAIVNEVDRQLGFFKNG